jgi:starch phosphorylase
MENFINQDIEKENLSKDVLQGQDRKIAYFSMEIGIDSNIPTYSGGLRILAADTIRACADLNVPVVAVSLLNKKGYFSQTIDSQGNQQELPDDWNPNDFLKLCRIKAV